MRINRLIILVILSVISGLVKGQSPTGLPFPNAPRAYYNIGWLQTDSGYISAIRDTTLRPKYIGTLITWPHSGVDTSVWLWTGSRFIRLLRVGDVTGGGGGNIQLQGDVSTPSGTGLLTATLATVNSNVGSFGSANSIGSFTVNGKGLITLASSVAVQISESQVTNLTTDLASKIGLTSLSASLPLTYNNVTGAFGIQAGNTSQNGYITSTDWNTFNGKLNSSLNSGFIFVGNGSNVATGVAVSGDATISNTGAITLTSVISGGTCTNCNLSFDAKGRITVAASGSGGGGSGTVTTVGAGNLSPLFTSSTANPTTTPFTSFTASTAPANSVLSNLTGSIGAYGFNVPSISNLNTWASGTIALLGNSNTWTALQTFGTLTTTGVTKMTGLSNGGVNDSLVTVNVSTGQIGFISRNVTVSAVQGLHSSVTGDSIEMGGFFFQPDTINTNGYAFDITNLPDKSTLLGTDSVLIENLAGQLFKVPSSSIGGGGAVSSVSDNGGGTLTFSPTTGAVLAGINLSSANVWTGNITANGVNYLFGSNAISTVGNGFNNALAVNTHGVTSNNNLQFSVPTAHVFGFLVNSVTLAEVTAGGSVIAGSATDNNAFLQAAANTATTASAYLAPSAGVAVTSPVNGQLWNDGTHLFFQSGGTSHDLLAGGSGIPSITGTSGGAQTGAATFAVSGTSTTATGLTIPGAGSTFTWTYPVAWDFGDNTRSANLNVFYGPLVGNTSLSGQHNTGFGYQVMQNLTGGTYNTGFGVQSLNAVTTGTQNTTYGWVTGFNITTGGYNTFLGSGAGSGDTVGSYNTYVGQIAGDLNGQGNYNTALGAQSMGAEHGAPLWNTMIGAYNTSNWTGTDTAVESIGAYNDQDNLANRKYVIELGHHINYTGNVGLQDVIEIGDSINFGNGTNTSLENISAIGNNLLIWKNNDFKLGIKTQVIELGDSGVLHYSSLSTYPTIGSGLVWVQDSSEYFVYNAIDAKWEGIPSSYHSPGGGGGSVALSAITAATATNFIDNTTYKQRWMWTNMTGDTSLSLVQNTTAAAAGQVGFSDLMEGANGTSGITTTAAFIGNYHSGTTSTNYGLTIVSQGAATQNYGLVIPSTSTYNGIGTATPTSAWYVSSSGGTIITSASTGSAQLPGFAVITHNGTGQVALYGNPSTSGGGVNVGFGVSVGYLRGTGTGGLNIGAQSSTGDLRLFSGGEALANLRGLIDSIGRWHIDSVTGPSLINFEATRADNYPGSGFGYTATVGPGIFEDNSSTGTVSAIYSAVIGQTGITTLHSGVTYTNATSLYIAGPPTSVGTVNAPTITNPWSVYVNTGSVYLGGSNLTIQGTVTANAQINAYAGLYAQGFQYGTVAESSNYTAQATDNFIYCTGTMTVTLPTLPAGQVIIIKDAGSGTITVSASAIDGGTTYAMSTQWKYVTLISGGAGGYSIVSNN